MCRTPHSMSHAKATLILGQPKSLADTSPVTRSYQPTHCKESLYQNRGLCPRLLLLEPQPKITAHPGTPWESQCSPIPYFTPASAAGASAFFLLMQTPNSSAFPLLFASLSKLHSRARGACNLNRMRNTNKTGRCPLRREGQGGD